MSPIVWDNAASRITLRRYPCEKARLFEWKMAFKRAFYHLLVSD